MAPAARRSDSLAPDAGVAPVKKAPRVDRATNGELVDLGLVGEPSQAASPALVSLLISRGFIPVIACIGAAKKGQLFNVNADTLAGSLAARMGASRLVIAGGTPGVLDEQGQTIPALSPRDVRALVKSGTASAGMVAKLTACVAAAKGGVKNVVVVDGRDAEGAGADVGTQGQRCRDDGGDTGDVMISSTQVRETRSAARAADLQAATRGAGPRRRQRLFERERRAVSRLPVGHRRVVLGHSDAGLADVLTDQA